MKRGNYVIDTPGKDNQPRELTYFKYFNVNQICLATGIRREKLYNNFKGRYDSLDQSDYDKIFKFLKPIVTLFFDRLGYTVGFTKKIQREG